MSWADIWKIILAALASVGGVGGLIILVIKFSSNLIAERLSQKYQLSLQKELEKYKAGVENKTYISKARFDREFSMYQDLCEKNITMVYDMGAAVMITRGAKYPNVSSTQEFIHLAAQHIDNADISYDTIEGEYDSSIFAAEKATQSFDKAFLAKKAIQDYVFTDGSADKSIERKFAEDLDAADEVCVYAKLPRTFQIPTPVGNYSPDWAIAFYEGKVKHIFFIAETKGTMESLELRPIEQAKISCAKKLFNEMSTSNVVYHDVDSYQSLLNIMNSL